MENPFMISFGKQPESFIVRAKDSKTIIDDFLKEKASNQVYIITGLRGSGKTVLLSSITNEFIKLDDWIIIDLNSEKDLLEGLASELYQNTKVKSLFLKKEFSFSFKGISFSIEGERPILTVETLIKVMLDKIKSKNKKVLITIDEVISNKYMKDFVKTFQSLMRFDYPVYLLMTGLYENILDIQNEKTLTFLYRAPKIYLSALNISSIASSYKKIFNVDDDTAYKLADVTKGYAYAYQVLGYILYNKGNVELDDDFYSMYDQYLQEYVYEKVWSELSNQEQIILKSFGTNKKVKIEDILKRINKTNSYFSLYRQRLIKKGILIAPTYGYLQFTLPRFYEYIRTVEFE